MRPSMTKAYLQGRCYLCGKWMGRSHLQPLHGLDFCMGCSTALNLPVSDTGGKVPDILVLHLGFGRHLFLFRVDLPDQPARWVRSASNDSMDPNPKELIRLCRDHPDAVIQLIDSAHIALPAGLVGEIL
jgi:hypothetical protein